MHIPFFLLPTRSHSVLPSWNVDSYCSFSQSNQIILYHSMGSLSSCLLHIRYGVDLSYITFCSFPNITSSFFGFSWTLRVKTELPNIEHSYLRREEHWTLEIQEPTLESHRSQNLCKHLSIDTHADLQRSHAMDETFWVQGKLTLNSLSKPLISLWFYTS